VVEVPTFGGGYTRSPVYVLGVPVLAHNELITKMMKKGVVVSNIDAVSGGGGLYMAATFRDQWRVLIELLLVVCGVIDREVLRFVAERCE